MRPETYPFTRYLAAKKSVDDRAINRNVWDALADRQARRAAAGDKDAQPLRVLELGAGIGTMLERILEWGLLDQADYTCVDSNPENIACALERLPEWASRQGWRATRLGPAVMCLEGPRQQVTARFETCDLFEFAGHQTGRRWQMLVAHAFLDLLNIPAALPVIFSLLEPGGQFYFSLNFDGVTLWEPASPDAFGGTDFDELVQAVYHRTMDERLTNGLLSGDSRAGRHLFAHLRAAGARLQAAGASDWVVFPGPQGYPEDEAFFLHFILHTMESALTGRPELDPQRLAAWIEWRHSQVEAGVLVYIAHQLDFAGILGGEVAGKAAAGDHAEGE
jgi:SAM-dependent methyltransferase